MSYIFIQACIAILILVGFESVTAMGEEAKNAKRDIPKAVLLSLGIQGIFCYLVEYFAANYFLNTGYTLTAAGGLRRAPRRHDGPRRHLAVRQLFRRPRLHARPGIHRLPRPDWHNAACLNTGARVTYAMGRDEEMPNHFGLLHGKTLTPHRAIWTLAIISAAIGIATVVALPGRDDAVDPGGQVQDRLVQLRHLQPRDLRQATELAGHRNPGEQFRNLPPLHDHQRGRDCGIQSTPHVPRL